MHNKIYRMCHLIYPNMHLFNFSTLTITPSIFWTEHYDRLNACSGKLNGTCGKFYVAFNKCTLVLPNVYTDLPIYFFVCKHIVPNIVCTRLAGKKQHVSFVSFKVD